MTDEDAIDILKNCIADYVIGDYCTGKHCIDENMCKYEDCPFNTAIDTVTDLIEKQQKVIDGMAEELAKLNYMQYCNEKNCNYPPCNKESCIKKYFKEKVEDNK